MREALEEKRSPLMVSLLSHERASCATGIGISQPLTLGVQVDDSTAG
jgi:hypothetical protein